MKTKINRPSNNDIMALTLWLKDNAAHDENKVLSMPFHMLAKMANASPDLNFDNYNTSHIRIYCNATGLTEPNAGTLSGPDFAELNSKLAHINARLADLEEAVTRGALQ